MMILDYSETLDQDRSLSIDDFPPGPDCEVLVDAAQAAEQKAVSFANAGDERMALLHCELSRTRRTLMERIRVNANMANGSARPRS